MRPDVYHGVFNINAVHETPGVCIICMNWERGISAAPTGVVFTKKGRVIFLVIKPFPKLKFWERLYWLLISVCL
jgi:hypothetical protein